MWHSLQAVAELLQSWLRHTYVSLPECADKLPQVQLGFAIARRGETLVHVRKSSVRHLHTTFFLMLASCEKIRD
jgi:hypothetical protein